MYLIRVNENLCLTCHSRESVKAWIVCLIETGYAPSVALEVDTGTEK